MYGLPLLLEPDPAFCEMTGTWHMQFCLALLEAGRARQPCDISRATHTCTVGGVVPLSENL